MRGLLHDLRSSLHALLRRPAFTLTAVLMLAVGLGATGGVFTLADALLLRPLDVREPQRLVRLANYRPDVPYAIPFSYPMWQELQERQTTLESLFAWSYPALTVEIDGARERLGGLVASANVFEVLGVGPSLGRVLVPEDEGRPVVALSHEFWRRRFGADPDVLGKTIRIDWRPYTIVGVTAKGFACLQPGVPCEVIVPLETRIGSANQSDDWRGRQILWLQINGRLAPGVSRQRAEVEMRVLWPAILEHTAPPEATGERAARFRSQSIGVESAARGSSRYQDTFANPLYVLAAIVGLLLLIVAVNIANLMLAHATARQRETAVRLAIGAGRLRLLRQTALESLWLGAAGAALGLALSVAASRAIAAFWNTGAGRLALDLRVDLRLFAFVAAAAALAAAAASVAPALRAFWIPPVSAMKSGATNVTGGRSRLAAGLLAAQIAFSLCLLSAAGLLVQTLSNLREQPADFVQDSAAAFTLASVANSYNDRDLDAYYRDLLDKVRSLPGVASAALAANAPLDNWPSPGRVEAASLPEKTDVTAASSCVSPELFATLKTPLLAGRPFSPADQLGSQKVAIVNRSLAASLFEDSNPIGEWIGFGLEPDVHDRRIVGVVRDRGYRGFRYVETPAVYTPCAQRSGAFAEGYLTLIVRANGPAAGLVEPIRRKVESLDVEYPVRVATLSERAEQALVRERALASLSTAVALIALGLASIGLYSLVSYTVRSQRRSIGVRIALGAERRTVLAWVLRRALTTAILGVAIGVPMAVYGARYVEASLFGVAATSSVMLAGAGAILLGVSLLAALFPAFEAASIQPMTVLRQD